MMEPILWIFKFNAGAAGVIHVDRKSALILLRTHKGNLPGLKDIGRVPLQKTQTFTPSVWFCEGTVMIGSISAPTQDADFKREEKKVEPKTNSEEVPEKDYFSFDSGAGVAATDDFSIEKPVL